MSSKGVSRRCSVAKADGSECLAWAVRGVDPPRCAAHSGLPSRPGHRGRGGAPEGNRNAEKHGWYSQAAGPIGSIEDALRDLERRLGQLAVLMDGCEDSDLLLRVFALYAQGLSRYGRLLRDRRALSGEAADGFFALLSKGLDEISTELGRKL